MKGGSLYSNFDSINRIVVLKDDHGHQVGDECLVEMGAILTRVLERQTDAAFRYGGEEFTIILPSVSSSECVTMVRKIGSAIRGSSVMVNDESLSFTASIGVASTDALGNYDGYALIKAADQALYKAKDNGRDCYVVYSSVKEGQHRGVCEK